MKRDTTNYALVGAFVVAMALALLLALFQLTGRGKATDIYFVDFRNTAGIKEGSVVTFEGHEIGRVGEIEVRKISGKTIYRLALRVQHGWQIPADSMARRTSFGLLAPLVVDIKAGGSGTLLQPEATIQTDDSPIMVEAHLGGRWQAGLHYRDGYRAVAEALGRARRPGGRQGGKRPSRRIERLEEDAGADQQCVTSAGARAPGGESAALDPAAREYGNDHRELCRRSPRSSSRRGPIWTSCWISPTA